MIRRSALPSQAKVMLVKKDLAPGSDFIKIRSLESKLASIQDKLNFNSFHPAPPHTRGTTPLSHGVAMGINYGRLALDERIESWRHHDAGTALSEIARIMGRHSSMIHANSGATVDRRLAKSRSRRTGWRSCAVDEARGPSA